MAGESRWIFTRAQLIDTPSRKCGIDSDKELNYRQQTANFIQDMGQRLQVYPLAQNMILKNWGHKPRAADFSLSPNVLSQIHVPFSQNMAAACLFLAAKVEEQPRKLEHVIKVAYMCLHRETLDPKSDTYLEQAQELVVNENILLQTLGFDIQVDHPHTHVVKTCSLVRASKDLAQTSYFLATNSLHLTSMCLQHKPTVVACVCIHLACKWSNWEGDWVLCYVCVEQRAGWFKIPQSNEGREWFWYTDKEVTLELLEALTTDFLTILDRCPSKLKKKILTWKSGREGSEGQEPTPGGSSTQRKPASAAAGSSSSAAAGSSSSQQASSSSRGSQSRSNRNQPPASTGSQPSIKVDPGTDAQSQQQLPAASAASNRLTVPSSQPEAAAGMRRVKTEPVLHQSLTPKEYLQRRERKEREMREQQERLKQQQQAQQKDVKPPVTSQPQSHPSGQNASQPSLQQDAKERHHMDIFSAGDQNLQVKREPGLDVPDNSGSSRGENKSSRGERPHGEQHHRAHQSASVGDGSQHGRRPPADGSHNTSRHHPGVAQPGHHHGKPNHHLAGKVHNQHSNNGHSEPPPQRVSDNVSTKVELKLEPKVEPHTPSMPPLPPQTDSSNLGSNNPPASSHHHHQKDLKMKINRKSHSQSSPSTEVEKINPLKMKIKLPQSPSVSASRREERSHKSSPLAGGDGLKLKLDLKGHRSSSGGHSSHTDDRHSHSKSSSGGGGAQDSSSEYQLSNQISTPSLKLVIRKDKVSMDSPGGGGDQQRSSSKRHHSHHSRSSSEKHHSRKRGAPTASPQEALSNSRSSRSGDRSHNPNKMPRTDSSGEMRGYSNSGYNSHLPPTNGTHTSSPGLAQSAEQTAQQLKQIEETQLCLAQLINIQQKQLQQQSMMPPLPPHPPEDSPAPPPPPPPSELPHYSFN